MELNLSPIRLAIFAACVVAFWLLGGFTSPWADIEYAPVGRSGRAWGYCILMFLAGAASVSVVDHFTGVMEPKNLRLVYVIMGILLMVGSLLWLGAMRESFSIED